MFAAFLALPVIALAGVAAFFEGLFAAVPKTDWANSQNMALLESVGSIATTSPAEPVIDGAVLVAEAGPLGTIVDIPETSPQADHITVYTVHQGENLGQIAAMFDISVDTIRWANDLPPGAGLKPEQVLIIPPISGIIHVVKKGDTIASLAKLYRAEAEDILAFNDLGGETILVVGDSIIVPDGKKIEKIISKTGGLPTYVGYFTRPVKGGRRTQGIHGHNGIDIAAPVGTPLYAAAEGKVIIARYGWNGGYGNYVVINHPNGTQTLYGHASSLNVSEGQYVKQGQVIAKMGNTGRSTGSHVHFEVHGARNPF